MSLDRPTDAAEPLAGPQACAQWFRRFERPSSEWKVGLEHEKVGVVAGRTDPIPYGGPRGIAAVLRAFGGLGYELVEEPTGPIAAQRDGLTVSIEPGGQLELSGRPFRDVHVVADELDRHLDLCRGIADRLGLAFLATGYRPWGTPSRASWVPKARYAVMRPYLAARGRFGEDMMAMTGSTQASFDFSGARDMAGKLRVALAAQPAIAALFANAPIANGRESGWKSFRAQVWTDVDNARCGIPDFPFAPGFDDHAYERYAEWALGVPMVFLRRGGGYLHTGGATFREFLGAGLGGERATVTDWEDHLTTLFPDVRVKGVVEVRAADAVGPEMVKGLAAFWKGLLYDDDARAQAWDIVRGYGVAEMRALTVAAGREGPAARASDGRTLARLARELVEAAAGGLCRQGCCGAKGRDDERIWLAPLRERAESGRCPADDALDAFRRGGDAALVEALRVA